MKLSILFLTLLAGLALGQDDAPKAEKEKPKKQYEIDIANLPEETRKEYLGKYFRCEQLFSQKRIFECLEEIREIHAIYDKNPATLNLRGACYVEFRDFDKAWKSFDLAQKSDPENENVMFNIAEIEFVTQNWTGALAKLEQLKGKESYKKRRGMARLIDFKILLCQLKTENVDKAKATVNKLSYKDDTPLFYYGKAALAYHADEAADAEAWLARGRRVFRNPKALAPWQDTLIEFGYIKSFYGGDLEIEKN